MAAAGPVDGVLATTLDHLAELVSSPTVSHTPNIAVIDHAEEVLTDLGATCVRTWDRTRTRANLFATIGPDGDGGVVLSGHTDVVPADDADAWSTDPWTTELIDGRVHGRGTSDMKGFIACLLAVAPEWASRDLRRPVHLALTFDEEIGCQGAPLLLADLAARGVRPAAAIVGEPTSLEIITAHKGCHEYTTTITGLAGHGSAPDRSVNAIWHAARYITRLHELAEELRDRASADSAFDPPETTLSIGTIAGGEFRNVVPASCSFDWEYRPVGPEDAAFVAAEVAALETEMAAELARLDPTAGLERRCDGEVGGLRATSDSPALALARRLLGEPRESTAAYSTEAGQFQDAGIPAVVCGPGSIDQAHRVDEFVTVEQLSGCLRMLHTLGDESSA